MGNTAPCPQSERPESRIIVVAHRNVYEEMLGLLFENW